MCININEMVTYFSMTLQRAAHFNKAHNPARPSKKGVHRILSKMHALT